MENYIVINGNKAELTPEQLKALGIVTEKPNPLKRNVGKSYYYISHIGSVEKDNDIGMTSDGRAFDVANYCTDRGLMQQRVYHEILNRLLWRYSMENGGDKLDWNCGIQRKYYVIYENRWETSWTYNLRSPGMIYFISKQVAENAIKEIINPFMEEHPDFKW
jgi:hypothetical protein